MDFYPIFFYHAVEPCKKKMNAPWTKVLLQRKFVFFQLKEERRMNHCMRVTKTLDLVESDARYLADIQETKFPCIFFFCTSLRSLFGSRQMYADFFKHFFCFFYGEKCDKNLLINFCATTEKKPIPSSYLRPSYRIASRCCLY